MRTNKLYQPPAPASAALLQERGAFVTLKEKGELRGCIGYVSAAKPLYLTVRDVAALAALRDAREERGALAVQLFKEFEQAAFALDKGGSSGIVQSMFGFHIIRLDDKRSAHLQTFDEVKSQIEPLVKRQKAQRDAEQVANAIQTQARTTSLAAAAAKNGFTVTDTDFFVRTSLLPGVGQSPDLMERLFSATEKSAPERLMSGGRTLIPRSRHSPRYWTTVSVSPISLVRREAMNSRG